MLPASRRTTHLAAAVDGVFIADFYILVVRNAQKVGDVTHLRSEEKAAHSSTGNRVGAPGPIRPSPLAITHWHLSTLSNGLSTERKGAAAIKAVNPNAGLSFRR